MIAHAGSEACSNTFCALYTVAGCFVQSTTVWLCANISKGQIKLYQICDSLSLGFYQYLWECVVHCRADTLGVVTDTNPRTTFELPRVPNAVPRRHRQELRALSAELISNTQRALYRIYS